MRGQEIDPFPQRCLVLPTPPLLTGYELNKDDHILALQEDQDVIAAALKSHSAALNCPVALVVIPSGNLT